MKNALQNLLILLSLCLCALIAFQWHRETKLRREIQALHDKIHDHLENIQTLQNEIKRDEDEIRRLDGIKIALTETVESNRAEIAKLAKDAREAGKNLKLLVEYKTALRQANDAITKQNEEVKKQNEDLKKLSADHAELVAKYNKVVGDFNDLARKWNDVQAAATNATPKK